MGSAGHAERAAHAGLVDRVVGQVDLVGLAGLLERVGWVDWLADR